MQLGKAHARLAKAATTALAFRMQPSQMALLFAHKGITVQVRHRYQYRARLGPFLVTMDSNIAIRALQCILVTN